MFYATDALVYDTKSCFNALDALVILNFTRKFLRSRGFYTFKSQKIFWLIDTKRLFVVFKVQKLDFWMDFGVKSDSYIYSYCTCDTYAFLYIYFYAFYDTYATNTIYIKTYNIIILYIDI